MRTLLLAIMFAGLLPAGVAARTPYHRRTNSGLNMGIKLGGNFDKISGSEWTNTYQTGYHGGIFVGVREHFLGLQGEVLISSAAYTTYNYWSLYAPANVKNTWLSVPALFEIKLIRGTWLQLGPQYAVLLGSKYTPNDRATNLFKSGGLSGVAGLQVSLTYHLSIGARYVFGLSDWNAGVYNNGGVSDQWKLSSIQLFLALKVY